MYSVCFAAAVAVSEVISDVGFLPSAATHPHFIPLQIYTKPQWTSAQLANYKIPSWADPHYSSSGNDRTYG
jgi:hypothetical protein